MSRGCGTGIPIMVVMYQRAARYFRAAKKAEHARQVKPGETSSPQVLILAELALTPGMLYGEICPKCCHLLDSAIEDY